MATMSLGQRNILRSESCWILTKCLIHILGDKQCKDYMTFIIKEGRTAVAANIIVIRGVLCIFAV